MQHQPCRARAAHFVPSYYAPAPPDSNVLCTYGTALRAPESTSLISALTLALAQLGPGNASKRNGIPTGVPCMDNSFPIAHHSQPVVPPPSPPSRPTLSCLRETFHAFPSLLIFCLSPDPRSLFRTGARKLYRSSRIGWAHRAQIVITQG